MNQQPKTWWGAVLAFVRAFFAVGIDLTSVAETAVEMADVQVTALAERMEIDVALESVSYRDQAIHRHALANAQSSKALTEFTTKNPEFSGFVKTECDRLEEAVKTYQAKRLARKAGVIPTA